MDNQWSVDAIMNCKVSDLTADYKADLSLC